jgi:predicted transcriptional regulator
VSTENKLQLKKNQKYFEGHPSGYLQKMQTAIKCQAPKKLNKDLQLKRPNRLPFEKGIYALPLTTGAWRSTGISARLPGY